MAAPPGTDVSSTFPFKLHRAPVLGLEMRYVDTQPEKQHESLLTAIFLHGNGSSSYTWRNVIPHVAPNIRCVAPDLIGIGESSKAEKMPYRFTDHYTFLLTFINTVIPSGPIILVLHDWGSALGLHWAYQQHQTASPLTPFRVAGLVLTEFIRPFPTWASMNLEPQIETALRSFRDPMTGRKAIIDQNILLERLVPRGQVRSMTREEVDHRKRPYIDPVSRELLWMWTTQIPIEGSPSDVFDMATRYQGWLVGEECEMSKLLFWFTPGN